MIFPPVLQLVLQQNFKLKATSPHKPCKCNSLSISSLPISLLMDTSWLSRKARTVSFLSLPMAAGTRLSWLSDRYKAFEHQETVAP